MEIKFTALNNLPLSDAVIVLVDETKKLPKVLQHSQYYDSFVGQFLANQPHLFGGKYGETRALTMLDEERQLKHVILVGLGDEKDITALSVESLGGKIIRKVKRLQLSTIAIAIDFKLGDIEAEEAAMLLARGASLGSYEFVDYITDQQRLQKCAAPRLTLAVNNPQQLEQKYALEGKSLCTAVKLARDYISMPANHLNPETYAESIKAQFVDSNVEVGILGEDQMKELGMGALLGVGQGSKYESKLVVLKYYGADNKEEKPIAFVGKGVTFDTGGICIKPSSGMWQMKYDMSGSAVVFGVLKALALRKARVNAIGILGLVENMPSRHAQRPGDVVTSMSGKTIEIGDTDAEGRLVLADGLWYVQENFKPHTLIDIATLTGAIRIALGSVYAGMFANDDQLAERLFTSGVKSGEKVWRMPMHKEYAKMMRSDIADICNISLGERGSAGSCTAANFLEFFIQKGVNWAHLDIAGVGWDHHGHDNCPKGAAAFGVRLLNQLVKDYYEQR